MKTLYHGSYTAIDKIELRRGRRGKDFGQGFYLSDNLDQAKRMAEIAVAREGKGTPIITSYDFDEDRMENDALKTLYFESYSEDWAKFIFMNRNNRSYIQAHDYDFVYGPIADDRVGVQIRLFQQEYISIETLVERLKFIRPTFQYFFGTAVSLNYIARKGVITL